MKPLDSNYPGIYAIFNLDNGKKYVGSAKKSLRGRTSNHVAKLLKGTHANNHLQSAFNKYGKDAFCFIELEQCSSDEVIAREQWWMNELEAFGPKGYNECPTAGSRSGTRHSEETKKKISEVKTGTKASEEAKAKMSKARKGVLPSDAHKEALKEAHWSKGPNAEPVAAKIAAGNKGHILSSESRTKMQLTKWARKKRKRRK